MNGNSAGWPGGCWLPVRPWPAALGFLVRPLRLPQPIVLARHLGRLPDKPWLLLGPAPGRVVVGRGAGHPLLGQRSEALLLTPELLEERRLSQPARRFRCWIAAAD